MAIERFPKRAYARQIRVMRHALVNWANYYHQAAATTDREWLQGRFEDRAAVLMDAVHRADQLVEAIDGLPRLS